MAKKKDEKLTLKEKLEKIKVDVQLFKIKLNPKAFAHLVGDEIYSIPNGKVVKFGDVFVEIDANSKSPSVVGLDVKVKEASNETEKTKDSDNVKKLKAENKKLKDGNKELTKENENLKKFIEEIQKADIEHDSKVESKDQKKEDEKVD